MDTPDALGTVTTGGALFTGSPAIGVTVRFMADGVGRGVDVDVAVLVGEELAVGTGVSEAEGTGTGVGVVLEIGVELGAGVGVVVAGEVVAGGDVVSVAAIDGLTILISRSSEADTTSAMSAPTRLRRSFQFIAAPPRVEDMDIHAPEGNATRKLRQ